MVLEHNHYVPLLCYVQYSMHSLLNTSMRARQVPGMETQTARPVSASPGNTFYITETDLLYPPYLSLQQINFVFVF